MGNPWLAYETETRTLGPAAIESQRSLTVRKKDEVVSLDGTSARPFTVREGGTPDEKIAVEAITEETISTDTTLETGIDVPEASMELREVPTTESSSEELVTTRVPVIRDTTPAPVLKVTTGTLSQALRKEPETTTTLRVENALTTGATVRRTDSNTTATRNRRSSPGRNQETTRSRTQAEDLLATSTAVGEE